MLDTKRGMGLCVVGKPLRQSPVRARGQGDLVPSRVQQPVGAMSHMQVVVENATGGRTANVRVVDGVRLLDRVRTGQVVQGVPAGPLFVNQVVRAECIEVTAGRRPRPSARLAATPIVISGPGCPGGSPSGAPPQPDPHRGDEFRGPRRATLVTGKENDMVGITAVRTVSVPVTDQDRALEFYVGVLGFEKRVDAPFGDGQRWIEVAPAGAVTTIALAPASPGTPVGVDSGIRFHTANADADHGELVGRDVDVDAEVMRWPGVPAMFSLRDPDGNTLYLVEAAG